jgi:hypothetical protein
MNDEMRLSPSQMGMWVRCQAAWEFRYIDGLRQPPNANLTFGKAFDATADVVYREKMATSTLLPDDAVKETFADTWDVMAKDVEQWDDNKPGEMKDQGVGLASVWRVNVASRVQPIDVQRHVEGTVRGMDGEEVEVHGYVDVVEQENGIAIPWDTKTSGRRWNVGQVHQSLQALAYPTLTGSSKMGFHVGVRKAKPEVQVFQRTVLDTEKQHFANRAILTKRSIEASCSVGAFVPNRDHMMCSRRWCGFWEHCEKRHGGKVRP